MTRLGAHSHECQAFTMNRSLSSSLGISSIVLGTLSLFTAAGCASGDDLDPYGAGAGNTGGATTGGFTAGTGGAGTGGAGTGGAGTGGALGNTGGALGNTGGMDGTGGSNTGGTDSGTGGMDGTGGSDPDMTCPLPTTFKWTSTGVLAEPKGNDWKALKDFSVTKYNGKYIVYGTVANGGWNGFLSTFNSFDEWDTADQEYHGGHVAPTIFYFEPKDIWVLAYQWGFQYKTTKTPDVWSSWSGGKSLMSDNPVPMGVGTGPIDQTVICDDTDCYLFFNDDAGGVYRASMPIGNFPGTFSGGTKIMQGQGTSIIFEGIQVYSIKGSDKYLMIIENNGRRAFRAWTADSLGGNWTPLAGADTTDNPFAGEKNVTWPGGQWSTDISHGDVVRENPSEKMEIDPCNLQFLYQGKGDSNGVPYGDLPYRPGLLTLVQ